MENVYTNGELKMKTIYYSTFHVEYTHLANFYTPKMGRILTFYEQLKVHKKIWKEKNVKHYNTENQNISAS